MSAEGVAVRPLCPGEDEAWDALVGERSSAPFFASREWADRIGRAHGGGAQLIGAFRAGRLEAGVALPVRSRTGLSIATAPYLQPFLELVSRGGDPEPVVALLRRLAARYTLISLLPPPEAVDLRAYRAAGWALAYRYTLRIPLRGETRESLLSSMTGAQRRRVRRAAEEENEIVRSAGVEEHVRMVLASYGRHEKRLPLGGDRHRELVEWIVASGRGRIYQLRRRGVVIASHLTGMEGKRAYALEGGADPGLRHGGEMALLLLLVLSELASEGVEEFDLLGLNHPGISRFKESFAGRLVRYHFAAPPRPFWLRTLLRLRGVPDRLEIAAEGSVSR